MSYAATWRDLDYLDSQNFSGSGPEASVETFCAIEASEIRKDLEKFLPMLVSGHAIGTDYADETIRFVAEVYAVDTFKAACDDHFGMQSKFKVVEKTVAGQPTTILRFQHQQRSFEVLGQPRPVEDQPIFLMNVALSRLIKMTHNPEACKRALSSLRFKKASGQNANTPARPSIDPMEDAKLYGSFFQIVGSSAAKDPQKILIKLLDADDTSLQNHLEQNPLDLSVLEPTNNSEEAPSSSSESVATV